MHRISVVGNSGSGKTSLARSIAEALAVPHLELDAIHHQPGWTPLSNDQFLHVVSEFVAQGDWVVDGNYSLANDLVWALADTVVWLDFPRLEVTRRLITRTLRRVRTGEELWNGNRESWSNIVDPRPEHNIILWSLTRHGYYRRKYEGLSGDQRWSHLQVVQLRTRQEESAFLAGFG